MNVRQSWPFRIVVMAVGVTVLVLAPCEVAASVPEVISYQGKLLDGAAQPVADGMYSMEFRFYDACEGGSLLLTDTHGSVQANDGIYAVLQDPARNRVETHLRTRRALVGVSVGGVDVLAVVAHLSPQDTGHQVGS